MEVLVLVDALKRASASRVTAAIPYMGMRARTAPEFGARADHRESGRQHAGFGRRGPGFDVDLHSEQIQGFFRRPGRQYLFGADFC